MTANKQDTEITMTTTTGAYTDFDGLARMTDDEFETEFAAPAGGTPRPGMNAAAAVAEEDVANKQAKWSFSQAAKHAAAAYKRRRSPHARTYYSLASSREVKLALDALRARIEIIADTMSKDDFQLLQNAIGNFRVKLNVHDSKTFQELRIYRIDISQQEQAAELATHAAFIDKTPGNDQAYIDAKERYLDLKQLSGELTNEIRRLEPKTAYFNIRQREPPGVPSQHTQISLSSAHTLRNIITPETARRTFISLSSITNKLRQEVAAFLTDNDRHKDRAEVVKQIKEAYAVAAAARKLKKQKQQQEQQEN